MNKMVEKSWITQTLNTEKIWNIIDNVQISLKAITIYNAFQKMANVFKTNSWVKCWGFPYNKSNYS